MTEEHFEQWKEKLWSTLCDYFEGVNPSKGQLKVKQVVKETASSTPELPLTLRFIEKGSEVKTSPDTQYELSAK